MHIISALDYSENLKRMLFFDSFSSRLNVYDVCLTLILPKIHIFSLFLGFDVGEMINILEFSGIEK